MKPTRRRSSALLVLLALVMVIAIALLPLRKPLAQNGTAQVATSEELGGAPPPVRGPTPANLAPAAPESEEPVVAEPAAPHHTAAEIDLTSIPTGRGLPVKVNVAVFYLELLSFDDTNGNFEATTDVRLRWNDTRLRFPRSETVRGFREYRGKEAMAQLEKMWTPTIDVQNRVEDSLRAYVGHRLRVFPNGDVETLIRETAAYVGHLNAENFPFDRQHLQIDLIVREDTVDEANFQLDRNDVDFSRASRSAHLDNWTIGLAQLHASSVPGWNGDRYGRMIASLAIDRQWTSSLAPIFIPLFASLLIPLLAIWMNKIEDDEFVVDSFEMANIGIGGLFSVIALSFAIYSSYGVIANSDNTVTRLFALNYAMLALTLTVVVVCFRYNLLSRLFGPYFQREAFKFMSWSLPVISFALSVAFMLSAAA